jgi:excisionase family DNA binding protein
VTEHAQPLRPRVVGAHIRTSVNAAPLTASQLLTADDLGARWQVPKAQVYRLTREGRVPAVRIGRYYRYRLAAIEEFEASGGVGADA